MMALRRHVEDVIAADEDDDDPCAVKNSSKGSCKEQSNSAFASQRLGRAQFAELNWLCGIGLGISMAFENA